MKKDTLVEDTVFFIENILKDISKCEYVEGTLSKELDVIETQFGEGEENFFGSLRADSTDRSKRLLAYRLRAESIQDRLKAFEQNPRLLGISENGTSFIED